MLESLVIGIAMGVIPAAFVAILLLRLPVSHVITTYQLPRDDETNDDDDRFLTDPDWWKRGHGKRYDE